MGKWPVLEGREISVAVIVRDGIVIVPTSQNMVEREINWYPAFIFYEEAIIPARYDMAGSQDYTVV